MNDVTRLDPDLAAFALRWLEAWERFYLERRAGCSDVVLRYHYKLRAGEMERARNALTALLSGESVAWPPGHDR